MGFNKEDDIITHWFWPINNLQWQSIINKGDK